MSSSDSSGYNSSSDESCLEIVFPDGKTLDSSAPVIHQIAKRKPEKIGSEGVNSKLSSVDRIAIPCRSDSSDSDEASILQGGPTFSEKPEAIKQMRVEFPDRMAITKVSSMEARRLARLETETQKRKEREAKKAQEKTDKKRQKEREKNAKKRRLEELQQANGRFAHKEIAVLMDSDVFRDTELNLSSVLSDDFTLLEHASPLPCKKVIQWIRKDFLLGGASEAIQYLKKNERDHYEHLDRVIIILQPEDFIPLLQRSTDDLDDNYPALCGWLEDQTSRWKTAWRTDKQPKFLLLLHGIPEALDRHWVEHRRHGKKGSPPPTDAELHDAIQWLLIEFQVECVMSTSVEEIQKTVHKMTRALAENPYGNQVSELECVKKIKTHIDSSESSATLLERASDTWFRQVQQIPRLSEQMASSLVARFPTVRSLWEAYHQQENYSDNACLLADCLSNSRRQMKLSEAVYLFLTSDSPNEMLF